MSKVIFKNIIQVAGIIDQQEADLVKQCGVRFLGFPLRLPVNKEDLTEDEAAQIIKTFDEHTHSVIISYSSSASEAIELCDKLGSKIIQLHGQINLNEIKKFKELKPDVTVIKSLVIGENTIKKLESIITEYNQDIDAFITDTFDPDTGASGATGKTHDWKISKKFVELSPKPVILAGGLNPENVYEAIIQVKPAGVDVHTGVENSTGRKDKTLLNKFVDEAKKAFKIIGK